MILVLVETDTEGILLTSREALSFARTLDNSAFEAVIVGLQRGGMGRCGRRSGGLGQTHHHLGHSPRQ